MANKIDIWRPVKCLEKDATTLDSLFVYWRRRLQSNLINMFVWDGLPFPVQELEMPAMMGGISFVAKHDDNIGIIAGWSGSVYGVTRYPDVYTEVIYAMPSEQGGGLSTISGRRTIGKDAVVLYNNPLSMGLEEHVNRYASLLAHADLTYKLVMVNSRTQDTFGVSNSAAKESVVNYYNTKYVGNPSAIVDKSLSDIDGGITNLTQYRGLPDYTGVLKSQAELLRCFYRDMGIRWTQEKRANMIVDEVESDTQLLQFNVSGMLTKRLEFCDEYNRVFADFASPISVKLAFDPGNTMREEDTTDDGQDDSE